MSAENSLSDASVHVPHASPGCSCDARGSAHFSTAEGLLRGSGRGGRGRGTGTLSFSLNDDSPRSLNVRSALLSLHEPTAVTLTS